MLAAKYLSICRDKVGPALHPFFFFLKARFLGAIFSVGKGAQEQEFLGEPSRQWLLNKLSF
jgi:hypothetical protein